MLFFLFFFQGCIQEQGIQHTCSNEDEDVNATTRGQHIQPLVTHQVQNGHGSGGMTTAHAQGHCHTHSKWVDVQYSNSDYQYSQNSDAGNGPYVQGVASTKSPLSPPPQFANNSQSHHSVASSSHSHHQVAQVAYVSSPDSSGLVRFQFMQSPSQTHPPGSTVPGQGAVPPPGRATVHGTGPGAVPVTSQGVIIQHAGGLYTIKDPMSAYETFPFPSPQSPTKGGEEYSYTLPKQDHQNGNVTQSGFIPFPQGQPVQVQGQQRVVQSMAQVPSEPAEQVMSARAQDQAYHVVQLQFQGHPHGGTLPTTGPVYKQLAMPPQMYPPASTGIYQPSTGSTTTTTQSHVPMDTSPGYVSMAELTKGGPDEVKCPAEPGAEIFVEQNAAFIHSDGSDVGSPTKSPAHKGYTSDGSTSKTPAMPGSPQASRHDKRRSLTGEQK